MFFDHIARGEILECIMTSGNISSKRGRDRQEEFETEDEISEEPEYRGMKKRKIFR